MGHARQGCLSCDRFMPSATDCSHSEPSVSHVATGPIVLSPGFEPGLDSSLDCCLYRLGYESMCGYHPCEVAISAQSTIDPATRAGSLHSCLRWTRILQHEA